MEAIAENESLHSGASITDSEDEESNDEDRNLGSKPFKVLYELRGDESDFNRRCFIQSSLPVTVSIVKVICTSDAPRFSVCEVTAATDVNGAQGATGGDHGASTSTAANLRGYFNPMLYEIQLEHGNFRWTVRKRYKHFRALYEQVQIHRARMKLHIAKGGAKERQVYQDESRAAGRRYIPSFPKRPEIAVRKDRREERRKRLEEYLQAVVNIKSLRNNPEILKFFEISRISFIGALGEKRKEGAVRKQCGGRKVGMGCCGWLTTLSGPWQERWFFLKDTYVGYLRPDTKQVGDLLLMDREFAVEKCACESGKKKHCILISNLGRRLKIHCWSDRQRDDWLQAIQQVIASTGKPFLQPQPHNSFAPRRASVPMQWYVDGVLYFEAVANAMEAAREEIFIADWWLSPELRLKRGPGVDAHRWRLDQILLRKAKEGVRIFILLYKEIEITLSINSFYSKAKLQALHHNIRVMRHPNHVTGRVLLYAHHEKCVIVDQKAAFLGGLDLCFGRWDTSTHLIFDAGNLAEIVHTTSPDKVDPSVRPDAQAVCLHTPERKPNPDLALPPDVSLAVVRLNFDALDHDPPPQPAAPRSAKSFYRSQSLGPNVSTTSQLTSMTSLYSNSMSPSEFPEPASADMPDGDVDFGPSCDPLSKSLQESALSGNLRDRDKTKKRGSVFKNLRMPRALERQQALGVNPLHAQLLRSSTACRPLEDGQMALDVRVRRTPRSPSVDSNNQTIARRHSLELQLTLSRLRPARSKRQQWSGVAKAAVRFKRIAGIDQHDPVPPPYNKLTCEECDLHSPPIIPTTVETTSQVPPPPSNAGESPEEQVWVGKDYVNWIKKDCVDVARPFDDLVDRSSVPRMPWHDVACAVYGRCARDVGRHFIQRWNATKLEKRKFSSRYPHLVPKSYDKSGVHRCLSHSVHSCAAQVLRSCGRWSSGISSPESSIYEAYLAAIASAEHFIYIENQFFISATEENDLVLNKVCAAIVERILYMHKKNRTFRVFIVVPLLPVFEGDLLSESGTATRAIMHYQYRSLCRGESSLLGRLKAGLEGDDPLKYVSICSLRTHGTSKGRLMTELIYVHSKLLIVDDLKVIIGSANLNDRSLVGTRDSELAVLAEDTRYRASRMNGQPFDAGRFAYSLRVCLMCEHLGLDPSTEQHLVRDPVCDEFYKQLWFKTAAVNTSIYAKVFNCSPADQVRSFAELRREREKAPLSEAEPERARAELERCCGHLVLFPSEFLSAEELRPRMGTMENLAPQYLWT